MKKKRIIRLYNGVFNPLQSSSFQMRLSKQYTAIVGLFFSNDTTLSLSLSNDSDAELVAFEYAYRNESYTPPKKRVLPLYCSNENHLIITGSVQNLKTQHQFKQPRTINVYAIVVTDEK